MTDDELNCVDVDVCECGGKLIKTGSEDDDVRSFKCKKCGQIYYNEADL